MKRLENHTMSSPQRILSATLAGLWVLGAAATVQAREWHVAPHGDPEGEGSKDQPICLVTALQSDQIQAGDTLLLAGGQYDGPMGKTRDGIPKRDPFRASLKGTAEQPILVTAAPGEAAHLNGTLVIDDCRYTHFVRLEIGDLNWDLTRQTHYNETAVNALGSEGVKIINCNIFGGAMGMGLWSRSIDLTAYGNLIHDFGWVHRRGAGHAVYTQNDSGTKTIQHNIGYRGAGWNFNIYTQGGQINGFDVIENIGFIASWHAPDQVGFNFGLTGWQPAERIRFIGNVGYHSRGPEQKWRSNMRLMAHGRPEVVHRDAVIQNNTIMGTYRALVLGRWETLEATGNTLWASGFLTEISSAPSGSGIPESPHPVDLAGYTVASNTYYANDNDRPFIFSTREQTTDAEMLSFEDWQALGLDQDSVMLPGRNGRPTGSRTFVFPNEHQAGRAHVAVFEWDGQNSVTVDLGAALAEGQAYAIYNVLDIDRTIALAKPVLTGVFDGDPVALPMKRDPAAPDFDAFLVLPR